MPLNKTTSPFFQLEIQQFSDRRCWGLERFRSQVRKTPWWIQLGPHRNDKGGKSLWGGSGPRKLVVVTFSWICCFGDFCCFSPLVNHNEITIWENGFYVSRSILSKSKSISDIGQLVIGSFWTRCSLWWAGYLYLLLVFVKMLFENLCKQTKVGLGKETSLGKWKTLGFPSSFSGVSGPSQFLDALWWKAMYLGLSKKRLFVSDSRGGFWLVLKRVFLVGQVSLSLIGISCFFGSFGGGGFEVEFLQLWSFDLKNSKGKYQWNEFFGAQMMLMSCSSFTTIHKKLLCCTVFLNKWKV